MTSGLRLEDLEGHLFLVHKCVSTSIPLALVGGLVSEQVSSGLHLEHWKALFVRICAYMWLLLASGGLECQKNK